MPPVLRKRPRSMEQPSPKDWFYLPLEMREMVIDQMDPRTRCRFAQCSKKCEKEAKVSRNYMYKIVVRENTAPDFKLELHLNHSQQLEIDYWLQFMDVGDNETLVIYKCISLDDSYFSNDSDDSYVSNDWDEGPEVLVKWRKFELGNPRNVRLKYLKKYLEKCKNSIRVFDFSDYSSSLPDFSLKNMKRLEKIDFDGECDKIQDLIESGFVKDNQLFMIKNLEMPFTNFTINQIVNFKGETMSCKFECVNEENINDLLKRVQNGDIDENVKCIKLGFCLFSDNFERVVKDLDIIMVEGNPYTFKLSSVTRKNGAFLVDFNLISKLEITWEDTE